ncbi:MAG: type II toxin-antitoxin system VapC family toxin [Myxococcales bacterium]|nr:type II toxin-antitoxin system VapC family toxin [Myxococcales bacterium]
MSEVVDSSAWLEYFADGPNASFFATAIEAPESVVVPSLVLTEVVRRLDVLGHSHLIAGVIGHMRQGRIVPLDEALAVRAASVGRMHGLALADSIVYATALAVGGVVWTQDADFENLPGVNYRRHVKHT